MYYIETYYDCWLIKHTEDEWFSFGPFQSEADAYFVSEMLNTGKLQAAVKKGA